MLDIYTHTTHWLVYNFFLSPIRATSPADLFLLASMILTWILRRTYLAFNILPCLFSVIPTLEKVTLKLNNWIYFPQCNIHTVTTDLLASRVIFQHAKRLRAAIFSLHKLASPSGRNVNYHEKQLTGEIHFWVVPSICTGFVNKCPKVSL